MFFMYICILYIYRKHICIIDVFTPADVMKLCPS